MKKIKENYLKFPCEFIIQQGAESKYTASLCCLDFRPVLQIFLGLKT